MQAFALHFGALALVQPILVLDLLFAVVITYVLARRRPDWVTTAGVLGCTGGLVLFLAVARPQSPPVHVAPTILLPLGLATVGLIALCLVAWRVSPRTFLPLTTALACGVIFGITAFLLKELTQTIGLGFNPPSQQWPLYAFIIAEPLGFLLNQNAFQESSLIAPGPGHPDRHRPAGCHRHRPGLAERDDHQQPRRDRGRASRAGHHVGRRRRPRLPITPPRRRHLPRIGPAPGRSNPAARRLHLARRADPPAARARPRPMPRL